VEPNFKSVDGEQETSERNSLGEFDSDSDCQSTSIHRDDSANFCAWLSYIRHQPAAQVAAIPLNKAVYSGSKPQVTRKEMPCFDFANGVCIKDDLDCEYNHERNIIQAYLDDVHNNLTSGKKNIAKSNKDRFKSIQKPSHNRMEAVGMGRNPPLSLII